MLFSQIGEHDVVMPFADDFQLVVALLRFS
jgi:hypothetical protein